MHQPDPSKRVSILTIMGLTISLLLAAVVSGGSKERRSPRENGLAFLTYKSSSVIQYKYIWVSPGRVALQPVRGLFI